MTQLSAVISAIEFALPSRALSSAHLAAEFPEWSVDKIEEKTGIANRFIAEPGQCSSDLAFDAASRLFDSGAIARDQIDFILLCTQSPDYFLPTTACLLQHRLGLPTSCGALDFNLGCSGFVYGLGLARGLVETGQASAVLLITAETYSKFIHPADKSVRTIFGDAAAATLIRAVPSSTQASPGPFVYGTDGAGAGNLIVPAGAMRLPRSPETAAVHLDDSGNLRSQDCLFMDGAEIFAFTLKAVPLAVSQLLARASLDPSAIDLFVFHQANRYMLEHLRRRLRIDPDRFFLHLKDCGNTVSSTIPIALKAASLSGALKPGHLVMAVGFGVGYSWGATLIRWHDSFR